MLRARRNSGDRILGRGRASSLLDSCDHVIQGHVTEQLDALGRLVAVAHRELADKAHRVDVSTKSTCRLRRQAYLSVQHVIRCVRHLCQWFCLPYHSAACGRSQIAGHGSARISTDYSLISIRVSP